MNRYHTFGQRLGAAILDGLVFLPISFLVEMLFAPDGKHETKWSIFLSLLGIAYTVLMHAKYGQTLGKMACKIKVVQHEDESELISLEKALLREIIWIVLLAIDIVYLLVSGDSESYEITSGLISIAWLLAELISMMFNKKRRAIHDLIAGSVVVDTTRYTEWEKKFLPRD